MKISDIDILPTAQSAEGYDFSESVAICIDVLRATSVMTMAAASGCESIAPVLSPEEGFALADKLGRESVILGGERNADLIPGFDLGNSPQDYTPERVGGRTVVMTTTNGTVAIRASSGARAVVAASLLNCHAALGAALRLAKERGARRLVFVCAGNHGVLTLEDCVCAAIMASEALRRDECRGARMASDMATALLNLTHGREVADVSLCRESVHYNVLIGKGYEVDAKLCLDRVGTMTTVPVLCPDGRLRAE